MLSTENRLPRELHVLLVEDDAVDAKWVSRALADNAGGRPFIHLSQVERLRSALKVLDEYPQIDVVLLDLGLPDTDSNVEGIERIHAVRPDLPIMVLSGSSYENAGLDALEKGATWYLPKSKASEINLGRLIAKVVQKRRTQDNLLKIISSSADGILIVNARRDILFANRAAGDLLNFDHDDPGDTSFDYPIATHLVDIELPDNRMAEMRVNDLEWDGRPAMLVSLHEITDRVRMEEYRRLANRRPH